jgi:hypothetical protein
MQNLDLLHTSLDAKKVCHGVASLEEEANGISWELTCGVPRFRSVGLRGRGSF